MSACTAVGSLAFFSDRPGWVHGHTQAMFEFSKAADRDKSVLQIVQRPAGGTLLQVLLAISDWILVPTRLQA